jgi:hypothetical protein
MKKKAKAKTKPKPKAKPKTKTKKGKKGQASAGARKIPFTTLYQGDAGLQVAQNGVIGSQAQLLTEFPVFPFTVNFAKEELIFVALGARPAPGYTVTITQVMYLTNRGPGLAPLTEVSYEVTPPASGATTAPADAPPSYPMHIIKLEILAGAVNFNS